MSLNIMVPTVANLKVDWFHCAKPQKSGGSITSFSKIEWFHRTTGSITITALLNSGPSGLSRETLDTLAALGPQICRPSKSKKIIPLSCKDVHCIVPLWKALICHYLVITIQERDSTFKGFFTSNPPILLHTEGLVDSQLLTTKHHQGWQKLLNCGCAIF